MMKGDCNDAPERKAADMRLLDSELRHRRQYCGGEIVAGRAFGCAIAVAVPRIVEGDRTPFLSESLKLRPPYRLVRSNAVKEDDWRAIALARPLIA